MGINKKKRKGVIVEICPELLDILQRVKETIYTYSRDVDLNISNYSASKTLAKKIEEAKWYPA